MTHRMRMTLVYAFSAVTTAIGLGSLLVFGLFLWRGGFELVELKMGRYSTLAWDAAFCLVFFAQHSVMVRRSFRARLSRVIPGHYHGAFYTLTSGAALLLLAACWQRSEVSLGALEGPAGWAIRGLCLACLAGVVWGMGSLRNFDAFGVQALLTHVKGERADPTPLTVRGPYRWVRHPFYSFGIVAIWAYPGLPLDRLLFNVLFTVWIAIGARLEERDLAVEFGDAYRAYRRQVPMLLPWRRLARP